MKTGIHKTGIALFLLLLCGLLAGCGQQEVIIEEEPATDTVSDNEPLNYTGNLPIRDNFSVYENWDYDEVLTMYLTVRSGNTADGTNHTWEEVNTYSSYYYEREGTERYKVEGLIQVGDENGLVPEEFGYGQYTPNAVVQIRGQTSTRYAQKNYRISIKDGKGEWEGQTTINLNKHVGDTTRFMNMLCYKLMTEIDGMMSARTKFVHLYVKDETASGTAGREFVDYGLYTCVEQINRTYLRSHDLDRNGQLYKINFFEFNRHEDVIKLRSEAGYDVTEFEKYLEIKGDDDHSKLISMLEELNDLSIPIEQTFSKWFDEENYFTWLAFHILMGNKDTNARNYFLYSPRNINKFYFISWDNDAAMNIRSREIQKWMDGLAHEEGISNYWGSVLNRRVLQSEEYRNKLADKIGELKAILTEDKIKEEADHLAAIVKPYVYRMPDAEYAKLTSELYDEVVASLPKEIEMNYSRYLQSLEKPMPFFLGDPAAQGGMINFVWDNAYDFDHETISYTFQISRDYLFGECLYEEKDILSPEFSVPMLPPGQYFYRVTARNTSGYEQMAFDYYSSSRGKEYGMKAFWVTENGEIQVEEYVE